MINSSFESVLWDINKKDREALPLDFIIKRVLVYGGAFLLKELFFLYGKDKAKEVFSTIKRKEMPERKYIFLKNYLFA